MESDLLFADKPLTDPKLDRLNYAPFAATLANSICNMTPPDGLVMAIYGPWGSGKSTLIEFILHNLEEEPCKEKVIVIRFNPWWFSGQETLLRHFFGELVELFETSTRKSLKKLTPYLERMSDVLAETPLPGAGIPKAVFDNTNGSGSGVYQLKKNISKLFARQKRRILIVMDDIDRLNSEEIRQLFALIKVVANFPNVTYLLAFDREIVSNALALIYPSEGSGDRFLEKIIQVAFEIPAISAEELQDLFLERISRLVGSLPNLLQKGQLADSNGYLACIQTFLRTPRDVVRLINTLSVTYPGIKDEVDAADFIAIESLRIFRPELYQQIWNHKAYFTETFGNENPPPAIQELLANEAIGVVELIKRLFPTPHKLFPMQLLPNYRKEKRVRSPDIFDIYFQYSIPPNRVSSQQVLSIYYAFIRGEHLGELLLPLFQSNAEKGKLILQRLVDYAYNLSEHENIRFMDDLLDSSDTLIELCEISLIEYRHVEDFRLKVVIILIRFLENIYEDMRFDKLYELLSHTSSLTACIYLVRHFGERAGLYETDEPVLRHLWSFSKEQVKKLEQIIVPKLKAVLEQLSNYDSEKFRELMEFRALIDKAEAKQWIEKKLDDPAKFLTFIEGFMYSVPFDLYALSDKLFTYFDQQQIQTSCTAYLASGNLSDAQVITVNRCLAYLEHLDASKTGSARVKSM